MILVSACLAGFRCRYDGDSSPLDYVIEMVRKGEAIPICPEQLGGLETPRSPCELEGNPGSVVEGKLNIYDAEGLDKTGNFIIGAKETLRLVRLFQIKKAILKDRSPSCGRNGVTAFLLEENGIKISWPQ